MKDSSTRDLSTNGHESGEPCATSEPIRVQSLLERCMSDRVFCGAMVRKFAASAADLSAELAEAANGNDTIRLARHAHSLQGLAANFSADSLQFWAAALERATRSENPSQVRPLVARVRAEIDCCIEAVPQVLERLAL